MQIVTGKINRFLTNSDAEISGVVLDGGRAFAFPAERAKDVLALVEIGSQVEVHAIGPIDCAENKPLDLIAITNSVSRKRIRLYKAPTREPEVRAGVCPPPGTVSSPLAPTPIGTVAQERDKRARALIPGNVTNAIEQAYDRLHRSQVMLAFVKTPGWDGGEVLQYLHEAKRTYVQALGRYQARDFEGASECAAASYELSSMIEILISKFFDSASNSLSVNDSSSAVAVPKGFQEKLGEAAIHDALDHTESMLGRVQWVTANGTLPTEDREQVLKLATWSEQLKSWASRLLDIGAANEASQFAQAAHAAAGAAEHVCKKCYVSRYDDTRAAAHTA